MKEPRHSSSAHYTKQTHKLIDLALLSVGVTIVSVTHLLLFRHNLLYTGVPANVLKAKPTPEHCQIIKDAGVHKVEQAPQLLQYTTCNNKNIALSQQSVPQ
jgi:hypothetical protein